jgi:hypothetical protein
MFCSWKVTVTFIILHRGLQSEESRTCFVYSISKYIQDMLLSLSMPACLFCCNVALINS